MLYTFFSLNVHVGRVGVVGGSEEYVASTLIRNGFVYNHQCRYTGAPFFSAISAMKLVNFISITQ